MTGTGRHRDAGLTLVEMLVVLALIGIVSGMALAILRPDAPGRKLVAEADLLAARLALAADEALVTGQPLAMAWLADGYAFEQWDDETGWRAADLPQLAVRHEFSGGIAVSEAEGRVMIQPAGDGPAVQLGLQSGGQTLLVVFDGLTARVARDGEGVDGI